MRFGEINSPRRIGWNLWCSLYISCYCLALWIIIKRNKSHTNAHLNENALSIVNYKSHDIIKRLINAILGSMDRIYPDIGKLDFHRSLQSKSIFFFILQNTKWLGNVLFIFCYSLKNENWFKIWNFVHENQMAIRM